MATVTREDLDLLNNIMLVLLDWSGVDTTATPDDTELIGSLHGTVTLGDIKEALAILNDVHNVIKPTKP